MAAELRISDVPFGWVFGVFTHRLRGRHDPSRLVRDRWGPRRFLALIVCIWSVLTAATGLVWFFRAARCARFIFGWRKRRLSGANSRDLQLGFPSVNAGSR